MTEPLLGLIRLDFDLFYPSGTANVVGSGSDAACRGLAIDVNDQPVATQFIDDDDGTLSASLVSLNSFAGFTPLALCTVFTSVPLVMSDFSAGAVLANIPGGAPAEMLPPIQITGVDCSMGTTTTLSTSTTSMTTLTTTTTSTTTTTTLSMPTTTLVMPTTTVIGSTTTTTTLGGSLPTCGDPDASGSTTATDALFILKGSVGLLACAAEFCDVDSSGSVTASDALRVLGVAVGLPHELSCPGT